MILVPLILPPFYHKSLFSSHSSNSFFYRRYEINMINEDQTSENNMEVKNQLLKQEQISDEESVSYHTNSFGNLKSFTIPITSASDQELVNNKAAIKYELECKTGVQNIQDIIIMTGGDKNRCENLEIKGSLQTIASTHDFKSPVGSPDGAALTSGPSGTGDYFYKCKKCAFKTITSCRLRNHYKNEHILELYSCTICHKVYLHSRSLKEHMRIYHSGNYSSLKCRKCKFETKSWLQMKKHMRLQHYKSGKTASDCSECGFKTKYERSMIRHKLSKHNIVPDDSVKQYSCNVCQRHFLYKYCLSLHTRKHTGERLFVCEYCDSSFQYLKGLKEHKIRVHFKPKTFICSHCRMKFSDKESLEKHLPKHFTYKCSKCSFKATRKVDFVKHCQDTACEVVNTYYSCSRCLKTFAYNRSLTKHLQKTCKEVDIEVKSEIVDEDISTVDIKKLVNKRNRKGERTCKDTKTIVTCEHCNEHFPSTKVKKRHLNYCKFK
ncbi:zinc finger protein 37-like [Bolinopsis microptera]|uniref:zinc finger protein 37-like n=1 Tax=Bolinopsis microptera TaxID=2820187 RepID=UPI00307A93DF